MTDSVDPKRTESLRAELAKAEGIVSGGQDTQGHRALVKYLQLAVDATTKHLRNHYMHEVGRIRHVLKLYASPEWKRQQDEAAAKRDLFKSYADPIAKLESHHPTGALLKWMKPTDWSPDSWMIVCRSPGGQWRSITPMALEADDREEMVPIEAMTRSGLNRHDEEPPFELAVVAILDGIGTKTSSALLFPPGEAHVPAEDDRLELTDAQVSAVDLIDAEVEHFQETGNLGAIRWLSRARQSVLGVAATPFTTTEAEKIAAGARRPEGRAMWKAVAKALEES